jgi:hypothetical protein
MRSLSCAAGGANTSANRTYVGYHDFPSYLDIMISLRNPASVIRFLHHPCLPVALDATTPCYLVRVTPLDYLVELISRHYHAFFFICIEVFSTIFPSDIVLLVSVR